MKTINDLPVEVLAHILSFASPFIDIFVEFRLINLRWNEAVKHRLSVVKYIVQPFSAKYNAPICAETMFSIPPNGSCFGNFEWDDNYTRDFISLMKMLPCLKAVHMYVPHDLSKQNKIFSYFNSRPTLIALGLRFGMCDYIIEAEDQRTVKLRNITMLSLEKTSIRANLEEFIERFFPNNHEFQQLWIDCSTHINFIFQKMPKLRKLYHIICPNLPWIMSYHLCDLEILGVSSIKAGVLEYLSNVTSFCSRLTSIHVALSGVEHVEQIGNFKQFNQVENLVIENREEYKSWPYAERILQMYPMVKNLSIKYSSDLRQDKILRIFHWMPNLSILHLVYRTNRSDEENPWAINVDHLVSSYNQLHGRLIKIRVEQRVRGNRLNRQIFKSGFDFMEHIFYLDDKDQPHILLE